MDIERAFRVVGSFGRYQFFAYVCLVSIQFLLAWQMLQIVFVGAVPPQRNSTNNTNPTPKMETIVTEWHLYNKMWVVNLIQSVYMFGVLVGNLGFGQLSDKLGRKPVLYTVLGMLILTSFISSFANSYEVLAVIRFFVGVFEGGTVLVSYVLMQELLGSSVWTISGNFLSLMFAFGVASLAGIASVCVKWRDLCWATSLTGLFFWLSIFVIPESPRWLYSHGKINEAEEVLRYMAMKNGVSLLSCSSIKLRKSKSEEPQRKYSLKHLFTTKIMRVRTIVMGYVWFSCSVAYYGLTLAAGQLSSNLYLSVALSGLIELPALILCIALLDRTWAGRRRTLSGLMLFCGASCLAIMFVHLDADGRSVIKLGLGLAGKLAVSACFTIVYLYATELFPTVIRNVAMGVSSVCARTGGILAPFISHLCVVAPSLPFVVFGVITVIAGVLTLLLPETLNQPVPDSLDDVYKPQSPVIKAGFTDKDEKEQLLST